MTSLEQSAAQICLRVTLLLFLPLYLTTCSWHQLWKWSGFFRLLGNETEFELCCTSWFSPCLREVRKLRSRCYMPPGMHWPREAKWKGSCYCMPTLTLSGRLFLKGTLWGMARSQDSVIWAHELPPLSACLPVSSKSLQKASRSSHQTSNHATHRHGWTGHRVAGNVIGTSLSENEPNVSLTEPSLEGKEVQMG